MTIGQRIKKARTEAHMTQEELATKLNIPYQSISQWERNLRNPKKENLQRIAEALGVSITAFYDFTPDEQGLIVYYERILLGIEDKIRTAKQENSSEQNIKDLEELYESMETAARDTLDQFILSAKVRHQAELAMSRTEAILKHKESPPIQAGANSEHEAARALIETTFERLNDEGQQKFLDHMRELSSLLVQIPAYQRKS